MRQTERVILSKIIKYCDDIECLLIQFGHSYDRYCQEIAFQYACNMCIIQIGELVSRLSDDFMLANPHIPWRAIKSLRNLHAHDYESVKLEIVWETLTKDIPVLRNQIDTLLK